MAKNTITFLALSPQPKAPIFTPALVVKGIVLLVCILYDWSQKTPSLHTTGALLLLGGQRLSAAITDARRIHGSSRSARDCRH